MGIGSGFFCTFLGLVVRRTGSIIPYYGDIALFHRDISLYQAGSSSTASGPHVLLQCRLQVMVSQEVHKLLVIGFWKPKDGYQ